MTLQAAIASGKSFTRPALLGSVGYFGADAIGDDVVLSVTDIVATDYVLEADAIELTEAAFAAAWDACARASTNVKVSTQSPLYAKLVAQLFRS